jgi:WD40 repeat protein
VNCDAPAIAIDFVRKGHNTKFLAAGCMDGTVHVIFYEKLGTEIVAKEVAKGAIKHAKYVRSLAWSSTENILATASADGCVQVHKLNWNFVDETNVSLEKIQTLQLPGPAESVCFQKDHLCCYARGTPYLMYFDLQDNFAQRKINLNQGTGNAGFDEHVSFTVMHMAPYNDYLALATDTSRNIIIDWRTGKQIRNLYGHQNDGYSQPKIAWSKNGQYLYGNTQEEPVVCVWDIASASIVDRLEAHSNSIRDMFSSKSTDTLVTTSFDKKTQVWLAPVD